MELFCANTICSNNYQTLFFSFIFKDLEIEELRLTFRSVVCGFFLQFFGN